MIRHVVMFRFLPENKAENVRKTKEMLDALPAKIPLIRHSETHIGHPLAAEGNADLLLISDFESMEDLAAYIGHPDHKAVGAFMRPLRESRSCVDYEIADNEG